ncbi:MAG TPA: glycosyl hydrolase [Solirubrobacterales bacterium]|nr:glycosyl hydrolase [Solirubrobacterales bacterium]
MAACLAMAAGASAAIRLGVYDAAQGEVGAPESGQVLDQYAATVGRKPDIVMDYSNLTEPLLTKNEVTNLSSRGETPLVSWQLYQSGYSGPTTPLAQIAAGAYDADLRRAAAEAKGMPFNEILIRIGHEMNGNWYGWSGDPSAFVAAWRHVVSLFRAEGVTNVKWVWSANVNNGSYPFKAYFPGEEWVDYTGLDGYNWGTAGVGVNRWQTLSQVFSSSYKELTELSSKPVILTEVSSSEIGGDKAAWIREGFLKTIPQEMPRVDAVIWFDRSQEEDWRIDSTSSSLAAYREVVGSSLYGGPNPPAAEAAAPAAAAGLAVESIAVTAGSAGTAAAPESSTAPTPKAKKRRGRLSYKISRKAKLRVSVSAPGRGKTYATVVNRPSREGTVSLTRLLHGRRPSAGTYRVTATAIDSSGARSKPRRTAFRVPRG